LKMCRAVSMRYNDISQCFQAVSMKRKLIFLFIETYLIVWGYVLETGKMLI